MTLESFRELRPTTPFDASLSITYSNKWDEQSAQMKWKSIDQCPAFSSAVECQTVAYTTWELCKFPYDFTLPLAKLAES